MPAVSSTTYRVRVAATGAAGIVASVPPGASHSRAWQAVMAAAGIEPRHA